MLSFVGGQDVVALLPTGFGKSLIFQLAPLVVKEFAKAKNNDAKFPAGPRRMKYVTTKR